jgi:hypothetical protein
VEIKVDDLTGKMNCLDVRRLKSLMMEPSTSSRLFILRTTGHEATT